MQVMIKKEYSKPEIQCLSVAIDTATKNTQEKAEDVVKGNSKGIS